MTEETRVVFITGAGKGLGRRMALGFGARGFGVAVAGIEGTHETGEELRAGGTHALDIHLDLTRPEQIEEGVAHALKEFGSIDVLINNAAVEGPTAPVAQVSLRDWETTLAVNLTGAFLCDRALIPH